MQPVPANLPVHRHTAQSALPHHPHQSHPPQPHEVIELSDSDPEPPARLAAQRQSLPTVLQPAFDPIPRASSVVPPKSSPHRASASPAISSLIHDPIPAPPLNLPKTSDPSPASNLAFFNETPQTAAAAAANPTAAKKAEKRKSPGAHDKEKSPKTSKPNTAANSSAPSPKPAKPPPAPPRTGNGLLAGTLPGMGPTQAEPQLPTIYIHVPLNGETNKYVNFARLAEERYGWAALNPKLAKSKLGLQLESGDEMVDISESESNAETGGTGEPQEKPKKRQKRTYQDVYDKNDPFIDDSEMLWEEQAATSKDGFFVYSGPLVPEGQKAQIERADGTMRRGRGRGRGSRGGGAPSTRGKQPTGRKPRMSKQDKLQQQEMEKARQLQVAQEYAKEKGIAMNT
ncbi:histone promoter control 2 [Ascodesmis nigricans]|uniref:Histone promoter control 2 n=1 Tax=Ascodesmis nigricans TaxID=341454 RepID=A0A4S2MZN0_9PEZI|nr:histone promoter control 2 [Ascodesmis nigricans]